MKIKLSERERWLLFVTILTLVFYVFFQYLYAPRSSENDALTERLKMQRLELRTSQEKARILQNLELIPLEKQRAKKSKEEQVIEALQHISLEVSKLKLNMLSIRPRLEEKNVDSAKAVFMDIAFTGRYNVIYKFMSALEKLPILIMVDSMSMKKTETSEINVNMVLSIYY